MPPDRGPCWWSWIAPAATAAFSGADSNQSSSSSHADSGSVRRNSTMSWRPRERNRLARPNTGNNSPKDEALMSGAGVWYSSSRNPASRRRSAVNAGHFAASAREYAPIASAARPASRESVRKAPRSTATVRPVSAAERSNPPRPSSRAMESGSQPGSRASGAARNPGVNSTTRPWPPRVASRSRRSVRRPALASAAAATRPFAPPPMTAAS